MCDFVGVVGEILQIQEFIKCLVSNCNIFTVRIVCEASWILFLRRNESNHVSLIKIVQIPVKY